MGRLLLKLALELAVRNKCRFVYRMEILRVELISIACEMTTESAAAEQYLALACRHVPPVRYRITMFGQ